MGIGVKFQGLALMATSALLAMLVLFGGRIREGFDLLVVKAIVAFATVLVGVLAGLALWFRGEVKA